MDNRTYMCMRASAVLVMVTMIGLWGCGGSSDPPKPAAPADPLSDNASDAEMTEADIAALADQTPPTAAHIAGKYLLDREAMKDALRAQMEATDDPTAAAGIRMMESFVDGMEWVVTLNTDGSATSNMTMMGPPEIGVGTWILDGNNITITLTSEAGRVSSERGMINDDVLEIRKAMSPSQSLIMVFKKIEDDGQE